MNFFLSDEVFERLGRIRELQKIIHDNNSSPSESASAWMNMCVVTKEVESLHKTYNKIVNNLAWKKNIGSQYGK